MTTTAAAQSWSDEEIARLLSDSDTTEADEHAGGADETASLSADDLFHLLQNSRRRAVLRYLRGREGPVRMRTVAEEVAAWENDTTVAQLTSDERQRVYISLYQSHLETLEDAGVIDYNKPRGVITPQPLLKQVAAYAETAQPDATDEGEETADSNGIDVWNQRYLGASTVSGLLLFGTAFGLITGFTAGLLAVLLFTGLTLAKFALDNGGLVRTTTGG